MIIGYSLLFLEMNLYFKFTNINYNLSYYILIKLIILKYRINIWLNLTLL